MFSRRAISGWWFGVSSGSARPALDAQLNSHESVEISVAIEAAREKITRVLDVLARYELEVPISMSSSENIQEADIRFLRRLKVKYPDDGIES